MPSDYKLSFDRAKSKHFYALTRLREKFPAALTLEDVINYAFSAVEKDDTVVLNAFKTIMKNSGEVTLDDKNRTYRYKPPYAIRSPEELIAYFQKQTHTRSMLVEDLKKGWADCETAIDRLEKEHKLMVIRAKKDNAAKYIWADDPALSAPVDKEFVDLWGIIELPHKDDVIRYLEKTGRTPAGQVAQQKVIQQKSKARKSRQSTKKTNTHMSGLFKDYSSLRQKGK